MVWPVRAGCQGFPFPPSVPPHIASLRASVVGLHEMCQAYGRWVGEETSLLSLGLSLGGSRCFSWLRQLTLAFPVVPALSLARGPNPVGHPLAIV